MSHPPKKPELKIKQIGETLKTGPPTSCLSVNLELDTLKSPLIELMISAKMGWMDVKVVKLDIIQTNMSPEKWCLEDYLYFPLWNGSFWGDMLV